MSRVADLDAQAVIANLHLPPETAAWVEALERLGPGPVAVTLPGGSEATELLAHLGVAEPDLSVAVGALPRPERTPELWWLLERCYHDLRRHIGDEGGGGRQCPSLPPGLGAAGRCFWVAVYLAALGDIRRWHDQRGIPEKISWATLADLGQGMRLYRRRHGLGGLGNQYWLQGHYLGTLYSLGRLQFKLCRLASPAGPAFWYDSATAEQRGDGFRAGDAVLDIHIPATGPLTPEACDASLAQARDFFARHFPEHPFRLAVCSSWLMDDQLLEYLPGTSNIARFQGRFELVPGAADDDEDPFRFIFDDRHPADLEALPQRTRLQRAIVGHVRAGRHWRFRTGWLEP